jgi:hypothetical protein
LAEQRFAQPSQQICLDEYIGAVEQATKRVQRLEAELRELVAVWSMGPVVSAMSAHRGVSLVVAATVCAELGDLTRFDRVRELMGFVGLEPSRKPATPTSGGCWSRVPGPTVILHVERPICEKSSRANQRRSRPLHGKLNCGSVVGTAG